MGPSAYIAGPLGFSEAGRLFYNEKFLPMLQTVGFRLLDPWKLTPQCVIDEVVGMQYGLAQKQKFSQINRIIGETNKKAIDDCNIIFAILDGTDVDSGTAAEIGYGAGKGKPIVGYRGDFRLSADNPGSIVNLQVEHFIFLNEGEIVQSFEALKPIAEKWFKRLTVLF